MLFCVGSDRDAAHDGSESPSRPPTHILLPLPLLLHAESKCIPTTIPTPAPLCLSLCLQIKNSWGTDWGLAGYILLARGAAFNPDGASESLSLPLHSLAMDCVQLPCCSATALGRCLASLLFRVTALRRRVDTSLIARCCCLPVGLSLCLCRPVRCADGVLLALPVKRRPLSSESLHRHKASCGIALHSDAIFTLTLVSLVCYSAAAESQSRSVGACLGSASWADAHIPLLCLCMHLCAMHCWLKPHFIAPLSAQTARNKSSIRPWHDGCRAATPQRGLPHRTCPPCKPMSPAAAITLRHLIETSEKAKASASCRLVQLQSPPMQQRSSSNPATVAGRKQRMRRQGTRPGKAALHDIIARRPQASSAAAQCDAIAELVCSPRESWRLQADCRRLQAGACKLAPASWCLQAGASLTRVHAEPAAANEQHCAPCSGHSMNAPGARWRIASHCSADHRSSERNLAAAGPSKELREAVECTKQLLLVIASTREST